MLKATVLKVKDERSPCSNPGDSALIMEHGVEAVSAGRKRDGQFGGKALCRIGRWIKYAGITDNRGKWGDRGSFLATPFSGASLLMSGSLRPFP